MTVHIRPTVDGSVADRRVGPLLVVMVVGDPVGQGNVRHLGAGRPAVHQNRARLLPWRDRVAYAARLAIKDTADPGRFPLSGPVAVDTVFTVRKPKSAPKRRRTWPCVRPDLDHYVRAVWDALTKVAFHDDGQVVDEASGKCYPREGADALPTPGVVVRVYAIEPGDGGGGGGA